MYEHVDFIEIGTSDFRTLTHYVFDSEGHNACPLGHALRNWDPNTVRGIAVDPVEHLLKRLPDLPGVTKVAVALGDKDGENVCIHVREDAGKQYPDSYAVWLARGTATVGSEHVTHPHLKSELEHEGIPFDDVLVSSSVPVWTFETLARHCKVGSVDLLKIDCEGADLEILRSVVAYCVKWPASFPRIISFETNQLVSSMDVNKMVRCLRRHGYRILSRGHDTTLKRERNVPVVHCCNFLYYGLCSNGKQCFFDHVSPARNKSSATKLACCYGKQCSRGHGGVVPKCIVCSYTVHINQCFCHWCWEDRWRMRDATRKAPENEQFAYWNAPW